MLISLHLGEIFANQKNPEFLCTSAFDREQRAINSFKKETSMYKVRHTSLVHQRRISDLSGSPLNPGEDSSVICLIRSDAAYVGGWAAESME